ncbi:hypothetical protein THO17_32670 [Marinomonas sp. THO17]
MLFGCPGIDLPDPAAPAGLVLVGGFWAIAEVAKSQANVTAKVVTLNRLSFFIFYSPCHPGHGFRLHGYLY